MQVGFWGWAAFTGFILAVVALDLGLLSRRPHAVGAREAARWVVTWVALALLFGLFVYVRAGAEPALEYVTGYLVEEVLSVDNIFVMVLIIGYFGVAPADRHRVLFWGILGALVLRGLFIGAGVLALEHWHWILYLFGALLVVTGARVSLRRDEVPDVSRNLVVRLARRLFPVTDGYRGHRFVVKERGRWQVTPLLVVLLTIEATDVLFAVDSIPAVFAITRDPFLVYTSNIFAVLGLRSLYFVLADVVQRFAYLKYALSAVLVFVGAKMLLADVWRIHALASLCVIVGAVVLSVCASLRWPPRVAGPADVAAGTTALA